jgi:hypothetical protein
MQEMQNTPPRTDAAAPALDAASLIDVWEAAGSEHRLHRAVMLLAAAWPGQDWARAPIGARDRSLFTLRECLFGSTMAATAQCPTCESELEFAVATEDLLSPESPAAEREITHNGTSMRYRLLNTLDLLAAGAAPPEQRRDILLERCALSELPSPDMRAVIVADMAQADPQADTQLAFDCPECGHQWSAPFDIVQFLWDDVDDRARRLLREVHVLAGAYGWGEREILALSAQRRRIYLDAVLGAP